MCEVIKKGNMVYVFQKNKIFVGYRNQWVVYATYRNRNRRGLTKFREAIEKSAPTEYTTPADQMTLAARLQIVGVGARKPEGV